jgi:hypothetical protein
VRLSQILSQDLVEARVLGLSKTLVLAYDPFVAINGNNVPSDRDMMRRSVTGYLDAQMEKPERRDFKALTIAKPFGRTEAHSYRTC